MYKQRFLVEIEAQVDAPMMRRILKPVPGHSLRRAIRETIANTTAALMLRELVHSDGITNPSVSVLALPDQKEHH